MQLSSVPFTKIFWPVSFLFLNAKFFLRRATSHMNTILILNKPDDIIIVGAANVYAFLRCGEWCSDLVKLKKSNPFGGWFQLQLAETQCESSVLFSLFQPDREIKLANKFSVNIRLMPFQEQEQLYILNRVVLISLTDVSSPLWEHFVLLNMYTMK